ncbi:MAG: sugar phosphate isomerase/epimerase [Lachnospiraceae bacterium]|nr:sugar phosphate isomerase/epimerase [Lachnospiraceae bacterium]
MDMINTPGGILDTDRPGQGIQDLVGAGVDDVLLDLSGFCSAWELETLGEEPLQKARKEGGKVLVSEHPSELYFRAKPLLEQYEKARLRTRTVRAPYLLRNTKRQDLNGLLFDLAKESLKVCKKAGASDLIVSPLFGRGGKEEEWKRNREYYLKLARVAGEHGITILLENQCRDVNGHQIRGICSEAEEAAWWVDRLNEAAGEKRFGFCMDTGVCNLCGQNMREFVLSMGSRIKAVILRDCNGREEVSALPFTCFGTGGRPQTDWLGLIRGLREIQFEGQLILDFADTAAAFSPLLRPKLLGLAKATLEYFRWQVRMEQFLKEHPSMVLFGAGNMCRNYMKCYGEMYPPLFTCDNNQKLWGTKFCGLEVKPPESLKCLPKDCAIFICNIYYREIERQIRGMGIENEIAFFNDEYMPSFYVDRLKRNE